MYEIKVPLSLFNGIRSGMRSCLILDESKDYLVNDKIIVSAVSADPEVIPAYSAICSVNSISTSDETTGLKKGHALVCLSVVSLS